MRTPTINHVLPTIARSDGGPSVSVRCLVEALKKTTPRTEECLFAGNAATGRSSLPDWQEVQPRLFQTWGPGHLGWTPHLKTALVRAGPQLIHVHGLWLHHTWAAYEAARQLKIPLVVSPRGMLEPWSLRRSRPQKWLVNLLFQRRMLAGAACIVATSRLEAEGVRAAGFAATPVAVVPNGVDLPPAHFMAYGDYHDAKANRRTALFLSRIHPKKGILDLLAAWKTLAPPDWRLRIVGPGDRAHAEEVARFVQTNDLQANVSVEGPLWGEAKFMAYARAELFILPSYSENFGLVIAEALAAGLPVITTQATPWRELADEGCGWWIEPGRTALTATLRRALNTPPPELAAMGRRGRVLMERRYSWPALAREMMELYRWLLGETQAPPAQLMFP